MRRPRENRETQEQADEHPGDSKAKVVLQKVRGGGTTGVSVTLFVATADFSQEG